MSGDGGGSERREPGPAAGPLAGLLAAWGAGAGRSLERQTHCGGAYLFVSREEADAMVKGGVTFEWDPDRLPGTGRDHIRVRCTGEVRVDKGTVYGLCSRCCGYESAIRQRLRSQRDINEKTKPKRARRDGYEP